MASRLGDQTARLQGRITLNPMYHIDPIGTLLIPALAIFGPFIGFSFFSGFLIGWAKPTPVITRNFKKVVRDDNLVTLAGPFSNLLGDPAPLRRAHVILQIPNRAHALSQSPHRHQPPRILVALRQPQHHAA